MFAQCRFALHLVFTVEIALVGDQRHLGVDHHVLALRQAHDHIGLHAALVIHPHVDLRFILVSFAQAGSLQHPAQHHLAPVALRLVVAFERLGEVDGFPRHLRVQLLQIAYLVR